MKKQVKKEKYEKPELKSIQLYAEEVLSLGCKSTTSGTAFGNSPCSISSCTSLGS
jgi:hypothetical protein